MTEPKFSFQDPNGNGRYYMHPTKGGSVPSITNIIGMKEKGGLKWWAAKEVASYVSHNLALFQQPTLTEEQAFSLARYTPFSKRDDAPHVIGDIVHGFVERRIKGDGPTHDEVAQSHQTVRHMWDRFLKFEEFYKPEYTGSEFTVWSEKYGYAGTGDLSMRINGMHVLGDLKTGKNVYPDYAMQIAALANADVMLNEDGQESPVPDYDKYAILHIRPRSYTLYPVGKIDEAFKCFLALKQVFDWDLYHSSSSIEFAPKHN